MSLSFRLIGFGSMDPVSVSTLTDRDMLCDLTSTAPSYYPERICFTNALVFDE